MILAAALALGLVAPAPLQAVARDSLEPTIVELQIGRLTTRTVTAFRRADHALIPVGQFFDLAEIRVDRADSSMVTARLEPGGVRLAVDARQRTLELDRDRRSIGPDELTVANGEIFLDAILLGQTLRVDWNLNWAELSLTVIDPKPLPIAQRVLREWRQRTRELGIEAPGPVVEQVLPSERRVWDGAVFDYSTYTALGRPLTEGAYSAALGLDLLGGSLTSSLSNQKVIEGSRLRADLSWAGTWRDNRWLTQLRLGDGYATGPRTRTVRGISLGNMPYLRPNLLGEAAFTGELGPGWQIEAYRGGRQIAFDSVNALGRFSIDAPIQYGDNPVDFIAYGPFGEVRHFSRTYRVATDRLPARRFEYGASVGACRIDRCTATANLDLKYGLSRRWTVSAGIDQFWRDTLPSLSHPYASLSGNLTNAVSVQGELVGNAIARGAVRFEPRNSLIVTAEATKFVTGLRTPILTPDGRTSQYTVTAFYRPIEALGAFYFEGSVDLIRRGASQIASGRLGASYQRGAVQLLPAVRWQRGAATAVTGALHQTAYELNAFVLPTPKLGAILGSATSRLLIETESSLTPRTVSVNLSRSLTPGLRLELGTGWSRLGGTNLSLSFQANLSSIRSYTTLSGDANRVAGTQYFQGSVVYERESRRVNLGPGPSLDRAGVAGRVFLDQNGNGQFDRGEQLLPNVRVSVGMETRISNLNGQYRLWNVTPYEPAIIAVDSATLASPLWVPTWSAVAIEPGPNRFRVVDIPISPGGVVEGRVVTAAGVAASGITLALKDLRTGAVRTVVSFSDGTFYAMGIKPGDYELALDPRCIDRGLAADPIRLTVPALADGATVGNLVVQLR